MDEAKAEKIVDNLTLMVQIFQLMKNVHSNAGVRPVVDPYQWTLIFLSGENMTMSELGQRLCRSKPNMTVIINRLIADGLVKRLDDLSDRRIVIVAITNQGRDFIAEKKQEMKESLKKNLILLEERDLSSLCTALEEVNRIILKVGGNPDE
jgi:DNA-binding MarR family transcriptional regulator